MIIHARSTTNFRSALFAIFVISLIAAPASRATNGMNMEGYGPVSAAMGGASFALDNGTAAVINNPATLTLQQMPARLEVALGILGPDVTAINPDGVRANSTANAFFMPAVGYTRRTGDLVYGFGIFGQGGMGCEYEPDSWRGLGFNLANRTEVSVGRLIAPIAWRVNDKLSLAASADFVWAGMDLKMAMGGAQFLDLVTPGQQHFGRASGTLVQGFGQIMQQLPQGTSVDYAYFNYSNGSDFTGAAQGYGYAGKIGLLYEANQRLAFGLTYHTQTALSNLDDGGHELAFQLNIPGMGAMPQSLTGDYRVHDFEWPAMIGAGLAWRPNAKWMIAADVRHVMWSEVMDQFHVSFDASTAAENGDFAGAQLDAVLFQDWSDQTVLLLGAACAVDDRLTLRFGANHGKNPIPDGYLNCLFPATVETHLTAGLGYRTGENSDFNLSLTHGLRNTRTSGYGVTIEHSQLNLQLLFSQRF